MKHFLSVLRHALVFLLMAAVFVPSPVSARVGVVQPCLGLLRKIIFRSGPKQFHISATMPLAEYASTLSACTMEIYRVNRTSFVVIHKGGVYRFSRDLEIAKLKQADWAFTVERFEPNDYASIFGRPGDYVRLKGKRFDLSDSKDSIEIYQMVERVTEASNPGAYTEFTFDPKIFFTEINGGKEINLLTKIPREDLSIIDYAAFFIEGGIAGYFIHMLTN